MRLFLSFHGGKKVDCILMSLLNHWKKTYTSTSLTFNTVWNDQFWDSNPLPKTSGGGKNQELFTHIKIQYTA